MKANRIRTICPSSYSCWWWSQISFLKILFIFILYWSIASFSFPSVEPDILTQPDSPQFQAAPKILKFAFGSAI